VNKILLIGCGHMGSALLKAWSKTNFKFSVIDPAKHAIINKKFNSNIKAFESLNKINNILSYNVIIFAIKPQIIDSVLKEFKNLKFKKNAVFVSIVAGKKISFFNKYLLTPNQFIRVMPNMPAMINQGMSCLVPNANVTKVNIKKIDLIFSLVGKNIWLKKEQEINKVTAISGSGPGYVFLIIDAFEKAAYELGLSKKDTKELVHQTFKGSVNLLLNSEENASTLAKNIAVKGGTTEAGLNQFVKNNVLHKTFKKVISAAYKKANILGKY
tara:strand:- start:700 stop:1509 length:810 start_codon:yes stop_codon:yes gene_type:complete